MAETSEPAPAPAEAPAPAPAEAPAPAAAEAPTPAVDGPKIADHAEVAAKLTRQIAFYLSDSNFRRDRFLRNEAARDAEGYIHLAVIAGFTRMRALLGELPALPEGAPVTTVDTPGNPTSAPTAHVAFIAEALRADADDALALDEVRGVASERASSSRTGCTFPCCCFPSQWV